MQASRKKFATNETQLDLKPERQSTDRSNPNSSLTNPVNFLGPCAQAHGQG